jgi:alanine dehydrogenase
MKIGVPKEIKVHEYRVGLVPASVHELIKNGHEVYVEVNAGAGIKCFDGDYEAAGATIVDTAEEVFENADLIIKVKEPQLQECAMLRPDQMLFTFLHLAAAKDIAEALCKSACIAIAYETVTDDDGRLPLLAPMSEVAGRLSVQVGAHHLEKAQGGRGILLGGVTGVEPAEVLVLGGGFAGSHAIQIAMGMRAHVTVIDKSIHRLKQLQAEFGGALNTVSATDYAVAEHIKLADLVVGAVLVPGASAPKLVTKDMLDTMHAGAVMVDISIDQGGCFETSKPTTHEHPTFVVDGVIHYCVTNMPGAVPRTSTFALNNATLPFVLALANKGFAKAMEEDKHLLNGLNVYQGNITHEAVAEALDMRCVEMD